MFLPVEIERITDDIRRIVEQRAAELIEIQYRKSGGRGTLTVLADKEGGISLDDCAQINRDLGEFFDRLADSPDNAPAALRGAYYLEVNSPGLDRPLKSEKDFKRAEGDRIKIVWRDEQGRTLDARGQLVSVSNGVLVLEREPKSDRIEIAFDAVVKAARDVKI